MTDDKAGQRHPPIYSDPPRDLPEPAPLVDPQNARAEGYRKVIEQIENEDECPFCEKSSNFLAAHTQPIIMQNAHWLFTYATWPYDDTKTHYLAILRRHITHIVNMLPAEWTSLAALIHQLSPKNDIPGGALTMRFGPTQYTGATVIHLHAHIIVPTIDEESGRAKVVYFPIG